MPKDPLDDRLLQRAARPDGPASGCLDPEVLAAWTDGTLTDAQRGAAEAHAADCDRCLMLLATMAKTEPPPVVAESRPWHGWRWVVPLATASIALTTWIIVRDLPSPAPPAASPVQRSAAPSRQAEPAPSPLEQKAEAQTDDRAKEVAPVPKTAVAPEQQTRRRAGSPVSTGALDDVAPLEREKPRQRNEPQKKDESVSARAGVEARTPPVVAPPADAAGQASAFRAFAPMLVPSPDPNVQWRLTGSLVERSLDAGKTWVWQTTGKTSVLVAGSSPAPTVCWLVGPAGTVLVTVDGERWRHAPFPDPRADIRTVTATDARHAAITTADKRTYVTTDGGVTWRLQEKSPAPF